MFLRILVLFPVLAFLAVACAPGQGQGQGTHLVTESQIKNGEMPEPGSPITHSAIRVDRINTEGKDLYCSGAVLSQNIVLTAAHCVTEAGKLLPTESIRLYNAFGFWGVSVPVEKILVNSEYLASTSNVEAHDMALILLKSDLPAAYVPALIETDFKKAMGKKLFSAGFGRWGSDPLDDANTTNDLAIGEMTLVSEVHFEATDGTLLFKGSNSGPALCVGDSGGPVYFEEDGKVRLIGISVAFQFPKRATKNTPLCADSRSQEIVASLMSESYRFILQGVAELSGNPLPGALK